MAHILINPVKDRPQRSQCDKCYWVLRTVIFVCLKHFVTLRPLNFTRFILRRVKFLEKRAILTKWNRIVWPKIEVNDLQIWLPHAIENKNFFCKKASVFFLEEKNVIFVVFVGFAQLRIINKWTFSLSPNGLLSLLNEIRFCRRFNREMQKYGKVAIRLINWRCQHFFLPVRIYNWVIKLAAISFDANLFIQLFFVYIEAYKCTHITCSTCSTYA